jgi:hypothetical protein
MLSCSSETVVTREEAAFLIRGLAGGSVILDATVHFEEQSVLRGYQMKDARKILRFHAMEDPPRWDPIHANYVVRLRGTAFDGRDTRVILGLRWFGACTLISIIDVKNTGWSP